MNDWSTENTLDTRKQLIQRATTRLRRRLLEEKLQNVMNQLINFQAHLEIVRVDTSATMSIIANMPEDVTEGSVDRLNRQLDTLEKRLESHTFELSQFNCSQSESSDLMSTSSFSSLSDSTRATSVDESLISDQQKKDKRRSRVKSHKKRYQESVLSSHSEYQPKNDWDCRVLCTDTYDEEEDTTFYDLSGKRSSHGSFCGSVYSKDESPVEFTWRRHYQRPKKGHNNDLLSETTSLTEEESNSNDDEHDKDEYSKTIDIWTLQSHYMQTHLYPHETILEEAMRFMDDVEQDADDGGFSEDLLLLLQNPDLCCRPFSEIESTMHELRQQRQGGSLIQPLHNMMYKATTSALQWTRFLSVLSASVVISIMKGPDDLLHNPPISR